MGRATLERAAALKEPRTTTRRNKDEEHWTTQVQTAMKARRMGAELRRGKRKSFRPVVGRF